MCLKDLGDGVVKRILVVVMSELEEGLSSFSSVEEELEYWKRKSLEYCERSEMLMRVTWKCFILRIL